MAKKGKSRGIRNGRRRNNPMEALQETQQGLFGLLSRLYDGNEVKGD